MSKMWERADVWPAERSARADVDDFARGVAEGRRAVEAEVAVERAALLRLAASLEMLQPPSSAVIASLMVAAVERLVADIAGQVPVDAVLLRERADTLAGMIAGEGEVTLAVHPDDVALLDTVASVVGDPALGRGTVQARLGASIYEDGVAPALDRLRAEIVRLGLAT
jgi:flagellar assembly protein FliH